MVWDTVKVRITLPLRCTSLTGLRPSTRGMADSFPRWKKQDSLLRQGEITTPVDAEGDRRNLPGKAKLLSQQHAASLAEACWRRISAAASYHRLCPPLFPVSQACINCYFSPKLHDGKPVFPILLLPDTGSICTLIKLIKPALPRRYRTRCWPDTWQLQLLFRTKPHLQRFLIIQPVFSSQPLEHGMKDNKFIADSADSHPFENVPMVLVKLGRCSNPEGIG